MALDTLQLEGLPISDMMTQIKGAGVGQAEASVILGNWLIQQGASQQRVFNYQTAFAGSEGACVETFIPVFQHADWVDGESVVQAQASADDEGFNTRFHKIEDDFKAVRVDLSQAFACMAEMRSEIRSLLDELRTQINLINSDLYNLAPKQTHVEPPRYIAPFDTAATKFIGATKYFDQDVNIWQTSQGTIMLPAIAPVPSNPAVDPRVAGTVGLGEFVATDAGFQKTFGGKAITKADLVKNFGTQMLDNGMTVADAVSILPDSTSYATPDALVSDLAERQAGAIRSAGGTDVVNAVLGVQGADGAAASASVANLPGMTAETAAALKQGGITTVAQLASADTATLNKTLTTGNVTLNAGSLARMTTLARTFKNL